jgi:hypothetical protein
LMCADLILFLDVRWYVPVFVPGDCTDHLWTYANV